MLKHSYNSPLFNKCFCYSLTAIAVFIIINLMNIAIVGTGYVGLVSGTCFANTTIFKLIV